MKVLVTGGTGFTGAALVRRLIGVGHDVVVLDCKEGIQLDSLKSLGADVRFGSITDPSAVDACMRGVGVVHHVAAAFREVDEPDEYFREVNVTGTRTVLEAAARHGVRKFVYCSTCGVHGDVRAPPADENAPITPADYYQKTKWLAELEVRRFAEDGLNSVILRPCALYGPGDPGRFRMLFQRVASGRFPLFGGGQVQYHTLFIENFVDALMSAMEEGRGTGGTYLVADEECYTIERLVREVASVLRVELKFIRLPLAPLVLAGNIMEKACKPLGVSPPIFPRRVDWYRQNRAFDISRAKRELGYRPRVSLREGLERAASWYREHGFLNGE